MANYVAAWRTFRGLSNEPGATAAHVMSRPSWPSLEELRILDIGCGDGRMVEAFLLAAHQKIRQVILLDPDADMLSEASSEVSRLGLDVEIETELGVADIEGLRLAVAADVALAIHVVYLLPLARFRKLIRNWPPPLPLYVVLDSPESVFSKLWTRTAPEFATRATQAHEFLASEELAGISVQKSTFGTRVANPLELGPGVRSRVLSLICYADFDELSCETRDYVEETVLSFLDGDRLTCSCTCYEIKRSS